MIKKIIVLTFISELLFGANFLDEQKRYSRVRTAIKEKRSLIEKTLKDNGVKIKELNVLIIAYKDESVLEIYAKNEADKSYKKISEYGIAAKSGVLGPKRVEGDLQVPEGFYNIEIFNPASAYYLSLGIDYPNISDRKKSGELKPGGDIFIHGSTVTIGCIPTTDDKIKEIYLYALYARDNGQKNIPVYIFPFKMTDGNFNRYKYLYDDKLIDFWKNLKLGYDAFQKDKKELTVRIDEYGNYVF